MARGRRCSERNCKPRSLFFDDRKDQFSLMPDDACRAVYLYLVQHMIQNTKTKELLQIEER